MPTLTGDIVVFSDANAMYHPDALLKLVRNFADPEVGCVTGEARYLPAAAAPPIVGEQRTGVTRSLIKRLETDIDRWSAATARSTRFDASCGVSCQATPSTTLNPLQIVEAGSRAVYERPSATKTPPAASRESIGGACGS